MYREDLSERPDGRDRVCEKPKEREKAGPPATAGKFAALQSDGTNWVTMGAN